MWLLATNCPPSIRPSGATQWTPWALATDNAPMDRLQKPIEWTDQVEEQPAVAGCAIVEIQQALLWGPRAGGPAVAAHGCPLPQAGVGLQEEGWGRGMGGPVRMGWGLREQGGGRVGDGI